MKIITIETERMIETRRMMEEGEALFLAALCSPQDDSYRLYYLVKDS
ncbi:MAG: hypothetical protein GX808_07340 [Syntrophomonadaceae bacterium]|jgi:hypothetical protein|nr:hypothetical protein [Syntrophomonadaceae bacterium]